MKFTHNCYPRAEAILYQMNPVIKHILLNFNISLSFSLLYGFSSCLPFFLTVLLFSLKYILCSYFPSSLGTSAFFTLVILPLHGRLPLAYISLDDSFVLTILFYTVPGDFLLELPAPTF